MKIFTNNYAKWGVVIIVTLFVYGLGKETLHFFNHFFPGVALGVILLIVLALRGRQTVRYEFIVPFAAYMYAIIPEFIAIVRGIVEKETFHHAVWEDIFLLHVTLDNWLEMTELVLPATALILFILIIIYSKIKLSKKTL